MIPFENTWPYEIIGKDVYVSACPFCEGENVLLPLRVSHIQPIRDGKKRLLVFPCCRSSVTIVDADADYLLANRKLRQLS